MPIFLCSFITFTDRNETKTRHRYATTQLMCQLSQLDFARLVYCACKRTENDAQKCFQIPLFCVTLFKLELAFHIYKSSSSRDRRRSIIGVLIFIHSCSALLISLNSIVFTVCKHEYMNITPPPPLIDLLRWLIKFHLKDSKVQFL